MRVLTANQAKSFYDRVGRKQDSQIFYERTALNALVASAALGDADSVFEFGCGTGRFALELLKRHLSPTARYAGIDISPTMVRLAAERLAPFRSRASVSPASGDLSLPLPDASVDRIVSTYVLDLLSNADARAVVTEARRALRSDGLLCIAGITHGATALSRIVMKTWQWLFDRNPVWVGGCRPTRLVDLLSPDVWHIRFHKTVVAWGVSSEILIASPR